ncbi:MAG: hypothetical protein RR888_09450 [Akkermansia sp.]
MNKFFITEDGETAINLDLIVKIDFTDGGAKLHVVLHNESVFMTDVSQGSYSWNPEFPYISIGKSDAKRLKKLLQQ